MEDLKPKIARWKEIDAEMRKMESERDIIKEQVKLALEAEKVDSLEATELKVRVSLIKRVTYHYDSDKVNEVLADNAKNFLVFDEKKLDKALGQFPVIEQA